ncbi:WD40/YVTN/BNR-like repeat-containing protein [Aliiglaciecola sp. M165]|uniref:WD40/YVTN/BNR-like repeat-containing protein n=1 Tax=Aliiglaciecola sp. M165 TaxID=2593649 RepID=UPI00117C47E2|nr:hypothetical protein [Aliiglaciecola sp. M165]TRY33873.1 hypothetical protein FM019_01025 [Aliiglaciecola sp. M165]
MFRYFFLLIFCLILFGCDIEEDASTEPLDPPSKIEFQSMGLEGLIINQFEKSVFDDSITAATSAGVFILNNSSDWQLISNDDWYVRDVVSLYPEHLIASVSVNENEFLYETRNNGASWEIISTNFGGPNPQPTSELYEPANRLMFDDTLGVLYAVGYGVLAKSDDFGITWQELSGEWQTFATGLFTLLKMPASSEIWFGGQNAIEGALLRSFDENTLETINYTSVVDVLESPSSVKSINLVGSNKERVVVSGEGGIVFSDDSGESWAALIEDENSRFYFDLVELGTSNLLVTSSWAKNFDSSQPLILEVSSDGGGSWHKYTLDDNDLFGGVWSLTFKESEEFFIVYLGLYKGGVFQVQIPKDFVN